MREDKSTCGFICATIIKMLTVLDDNLTEEQIHLFENSLASKLNLSKDDLKSTYFTIDFMMSCAPPEYQCLPLREKTLTQIRVYSGFSSQLSENEKNELIAIVEDASMDSNLTRPTSTALRNWLLNIYQS